MQLISVKIVGFNRLQTSSRVWGASVCWFEAIQGLRLKKCCEGKEHMWKSAWRIKAFSSSVLQVTCDWRWGPPAAGLIETTKQGRLWSILSGSPPPSCLVVLEVWKMRPSHLVSTRRCPGGSLECRHAEGRSDQSLSNLGIHSCHFLRPETSLNWSRRGSWHSPFPPFFKFLSVSLHLCSGWHGKKKQIYFRSVLLSVTSNYSPRVCSPNPPPPTDHYCHSKHTGAISDRHSRARRCVRTLQAISVCVRRQVVPTSDRPPTCSGSSNSCQFGFSGRAANRISLSALERSQHVSSSSSVRRGESVGPAVGRRRRWAECNEALRTGAAKQIMSQNQRNGLIIELWDLGALLRIWGLIANIYAGSFF